MSYPGVYVAQIAMGANMQQTINALIEAEKHDGPSIVIAYATCINHGIKGGMVNTAEIEKLAVHSGYYPIFRYNPTENKLSLDYKEPDFETFFDFLDRQNRFALLRTINSDKADLLFNELKEDAKKRFEFYKSMMKKEDNY
jgi:pyruvate-ferredoxin/flavodoxin oxidoreductase